MAESMEKSANQRVTNSRIFSKLETMDARLESVEETCGITAAHSIRCATKWDQYEKDEERRSSARSEKVDQTQGNKTAASNRQIAVIAGVVAVAVAIINLVSFAIQAAFF